jgi:hypothetical protein
MAARVPGTVYLLHLSELYVPYPDAPPWSCARHYTGWAGGGARGLARRLREHGTAHGSPLLLAARRAGISWELARTWPGTREREVQLKRQGGASRRCPLCGIVPRVLEVLLNANGSVSRSRTGDVQKALAGVMTAAEQAGHTALRRGAARGRVPGLVRLASTPPADSWYSLAVTADRAAC